jgi:hypothetical protein
VASPDAHLVASVDKRLPLKLLQHLLVLHMNDSFFKSPSASAEFGALHGVTQCLSACVSLSRVCICVWGWGLICCYL